MKKETFNYTTEEEKNIILTFLFALYGHYYAAGKGRARVDKKHKIITLTLDE